MQLQVDLQGDRVVGCFVINNTTPILGWKNERFLEVMALLSLRSVSYRLIIIQYKTFFNNISFKPLQFQCIGGWIRPFEVEGLRVTTRKMIWN